MLWSWIGDFRRHTLSHIYRDPALPPREKLIRIMERHKACLGTHTQIIISRYRAQWHQQKASACTTLATALNNLHILHNMNNCIADLDPTKVLSSYEFIIELIPTLQHDNFCGIIDKWNNMTAHTLPLDIASIQPALEKCFFVKNSINDVDRYNHIGNTPTSQLTGRPPPATNSPSHKIPLCICSHLANSANNPRPTKSNDDRRHHRL
jgi:hypothetical protein